MRTTTVFCIPGEPRGQGRARHTRDGITYKDRKDRTREALIALAYQQAEPSLEPYPGPVALKVTATYTPPRSWSKKKQCNPGPKVSKPDLDNILKSVKDGLNRIAWIDDAQVIRIDASKQWGAQNGIIVEIERL